MLVRCLGRYGNGRYFDLLKAVQKNSLSNNIRKHAKIALKDAFRADEQYIEGTVKLSPLPLTQDETVLINMLKSGAEEKIIEASKYIVYSRTYRYQIFDTAIEILPMYTTKESDNGIAKWLLEVIATSYNAKYINTLENISKDTNDAFIKRRIFSATGHLKPKKNSKRSRIIN